MNFKVLGRDAYVYTGGHALDAKKQSLLFIHGGEQDHSAWALQSRYFAYHGYNVLVPDLPGHGRSAGPPLATIAALADWIAELLNSTHIQQAAIAGHSMGALIALELAMRAPQHVNKLALLGSSVPMPVAAPLLEAAQKNDHAALEMINAWSHSARAHVGGNIVPGYWMLGANMRLMERQANGVLYADFKACNDYAPAAIANIDCPVLMIAGSRDQMTPLVATRELQRRIPRTRLIVLEGAGHALMAEQPDAVLDALIEFF